MRYCEKEFPPYHFIPGQSQHPEKEGGYLRGKTIDSFDFAETNYKTNETYLYGIDLFNHEYYWEAHVYWEVLWNHVGRKSSHGYFLQALIKLAAAGVKDKLNQPEACQGHIERALEHLELVREQELFGFNKINLTKQIIEHGHKFKMEIA
jgi:hypothetical protein